MSVNTNQQKELYCHCIMLSNPTVLVLDAELRSSCKQDTANAKLLDTLHASLSALCNSVHASVNCNLIVMLCRITCMCCSASNPTVLDAKLLLFCRQDTPNGRAA